MTKTIIPAAFISLFCISNIIARQEVVKISEAPGSTAWQDLFTKDLSNDEFPGGIRIFTDGILTASEDQCMQTKKG